MAYHFTGVHFWKLRARLEQYRYQRAWTTFLNEKFWRWKGVENQPDGLIDPDPYPPQFIEQPLDHFDPKVTVFDLIN